jgi:hypothetical protein
MQTHPDCLAGTGRAHFPIFVEAGPDDCSIAFIRESKIDPFSFFNRLHRGRSQGFIRRDREVFVHQLAIDLCRKGYWWPGGVHLLAGSLLLAFVWLLVHVPLRYGRYELCASNEVLGPLIHGDVDVLLPK